MRVSESIPQIVSSKFNPQTVHQGSNMVVAVHIRMLVAQLVDFDIVVDHRSNVYFEKDEKKIQISEKVSFFFQIVKKLLWCHVTVSSLTRAATTVMFMMR